MIPFKAPVQEQVQAPMIAKQQELVEVPQVEVVDKIVEVLNMISEWALGQTKDIVPNALVGKLLGKEVAAKARDYAMKLYQRGLELMAKRGLIVIMST